MPEVVTGDAVVLDVPIAQLPMRAVGALIDIAVIVIGYLVALMLWAATLTQFDEAVTADGVAELATGLSTLFVQGTPCMRVEAEALCTGASGERAAFMGEWVVHM